MQNGTESLVVNTEQAMVMTGLGRDTIQALVKKGVLPSLSAKKIRIPKVALIRFIEQGGSQVAQ
jgi:predicted DNA-binding transcriptional regulator AlpA